MAPYKPVNPTGFDCVNILMQKAIKKVTVMARNRADARGWGKANAQQKNATNKRYYDTHTAECRQMVRDWTARNRDHERQRVTRTTRERRARDPVARIKHRIRARLTGFLAGKGAGKADATFIQMGCTTAELVAYLEPQLDDGETLADMRMDHIFPMARYDVLDEAEQKKMMHWTNLQPLTYEENTSKRDRLPTKAMAAKVRRDCWPRGVDESMLPDIYDGWSTALRK